MTRTTFILFVVVAVVAVINATRVNECGSGKALEDTTAVQITNCDAPPCKLRKRTTVQMQQRFTPDHDVETLRTSVHATLLGVPLPFIGVDGTDACSKVFSTDGQQVSCPLKKGVEYVYKNEFPILQIYPSVSLVVYWALQDNNTRVACFEVPSRIV